MKTRISLLALIGSCLCFLGCATATYTTTNRIDVDDESNDGGGITSADVRLVATSMCPEILALPEVIDSDETIRIKVADVKNSSRFFIDRNLFTKRLCVELNRHGDGAIRFINSTSTTQTARQSVHSDRSKKAFKKQLGLAAKAFVSSPLVEQATNPIKVALIPVLNANLVNMNADSFAAMFRGEIADVANGKVQFLMPGETEGADYWLTGQFYPDSIKMEGIINLANYIEVIDERVKKGESMYLPEVAMASATPFSATAIATSSKETELLKMLRNPELQKIPDCEKKLNLMVVKPDNKVAVWEKTITAEQKFSTNDGNAQYILSGEISGMSQNTNGVMSDYLLITMELVDAESNEIVWQDAYEVKRLTKSGTVYR